MTAIIRKKSLRYCMVLSIIVFLVLNLVCWLYMILYQESNIFADKDHQNSRQMHMRLLEETRKTLALKVTTPTPSPIKNGSLPHKTYLISRKRCSSKVFLLIIVCSSLYNFNRRSGIRKTWAVDHSLKFRWKTVFLIGQDLGDKVKNKYLDVEEKRYEDLITGAHIDSFRNLTLKIQMGLEWASKYCEFQFLLKADDDVFVNPYKLIDYLEKPDTPKTKVYMGLCRRNVIPMRQGKYEVSWEEYNKTRYPDFCTGPAYVLSPDLAHQLVQMFDVSKKHFPLADVYIGLLLEEMGGVKITHNELFSGIDPGNCSHYAGVFSYHNAKTPQCMDQLFNLAMKERIEFGVQ